jgi:hypothetical protein
MPLRRARCRNLSCVAFQRFWVLGCVGRITAIRIAKIRARSLARFLAVRFWESTNAETDDGWTPVLKIFRSDLCPTVIDEWFGDHNKIGTIGGKE